MPRHVLGFRSLSPPTKGLRGTSSPLAPTTLRFQVFYPSRATTDPGRHLLRPSGLLRGRRGVENGPKEKPVWCTFNSQIFESSISDMSGHGTSSSVTCLCTSYLDPRCVLYGPFHGVQREVKAYLTSGTGPTPDPLTSPVPPLGRRDTSSLSPGDRRPVDPRNAGRIEESTSPHRSRRLTFNF